MKIELNTEAMARVDQAQDNLDALEQQKASLEQHVLNGEIEPRSFADLEAQINYARTRLGITEAAAQAERDGLADEKELNMAFTEFEKDEAIGSEKLVAAAAEISAVADGLEKLIAAREAAIITWIARFKKLGIPFAGASIEGDPISIFSDGQRREIHLARRSVAPLYGHSGLSSEIAAALPSFSNLDRRNTTPALYKVRVLQAIGGHKAGAIVTNRTNAESALKRLVETGHAEEITD